VKYSKKVVAGSAFSTWNLLPLAGLLQFMPRIRKALRSNLKIWRECEFQYFNRQSHEPASADITLALISQKIPKICFFSLRKSLVCNNVIFLTEV